MILMLCRRCCPPALIAKGFRVLSALVFALPSAAHEDEFVWWWLFPPADPTSTAVIVTPEAAFAHCLLNKMLNSTLIC